MKTIPQEAREYAEAVYLQAAQASGKEYRDSHQASQRDLAARGLVATGMAISRVPLSAAKGGILNGGT